MSISHSEEIWNNINLLEDLLYNGGFKRNHGEFIPDNEIYVPAVQEEYKEEISSEANVELNIPSYGVTQPTVLITVDSGLNTDGLYEGDIRSFMGKWFDGIQLDWQAVCSYIQIPVNYPTDPESRKVVITEIKKYNPKAILCFGQNPASYLLGTKVSLEVLRGQVYRVENYPLLPTYAPPLVYKDPQLKRPVWEDLKRLRGLIDYA
ncbi:uracil-DNA glycosylase family protein [Spirochaeta cellobiosiphila]|uniref:uracil-DNA glycosylase family protein n=1 Tax=Spirochaeta cellobiosiphila TaxID=504483 RepID=UPI00041DF740|nr:uracil-DNA glycosylase family protein [Spirochaeta cellobiosiphila]